MITLTKRKKKKCNKGKFPDRPPEHDKWSAAVKLRDGYICQECGNHNRKELHAHHKKPWASHPHLRFLIENGVTLCEKCHSKHHPEMKNFILGKRRKKAKRLNRIIKLFNK